LQRTKLGEGTYEDMAIVVAPQGGATNGSSSDTTIAGAVVENCQYAYWLVWDLPAGATESTGVHGQAVLLEYGFQIFLPLIIKQGGAQVGAHTQPKTPLPARACASNGAGG
jgi:hypothetical protein